MLDKKITLQGIPDNPGVYLMINKQGVVLYIGKAKNLNKRVSNYFRMHNFDTKTSVMFRQINEIKTIVSSSEHHALLLENTLIKTHKPKYNILLRDDKSYPYLYLSAHKFPRLAFYRGKKGHKGSYYGPYTSIASANKTLNILQKLFKIRDCKDSYFQHRSRPCLQYQIDRCSAPCVNYISKNDYADSMRLAKLFLTEKNSILIEELTEKMDLAAQNKKFEQATEYRNMVRTLTDSIQQSDVSTKSAENIDFIVLEERQELTSIQLLIIRSGEISDNRNFMYNNIQGDIKDKVMSFALQYYSQEYLTHGFPHALVFAPRPKNTAVLTEHIYKQHNVKVSILSRLTKRKQNWLDIAYANLQKIMKASMYESSFSQVFIELSEKINNNNSSVSRIECVDISHTSGDQSVASFVVFTENGPEKSLYRRFNIDIGNSDCASIAKAVKCRLTQCRQNCIDYPNIILIDGGKGQLNAAQKVINDLKLSEISLASIVKHKSRKAGRERILCLINSEIKQIQLPQNLLNRLLFMRDEAHRFAITAHRKRRSKTSMASMFDEINGIGPKKKHAIMLHFHGLQEIKNASISLLCNVPGIDKQLAEKIRDYFANA